MGSGKLANSDTMLALLDGFSANVNQTENMSNFFNLMWDVDTAAGSLAAPMPGRVVRVMTQPGARVAKGEPLVILEAMKMEHTIAAPSDGVVKEIHFADGEQVLEGAQLITLE